MTASTSPPLLVASAPNGAYKTRDDHRALPMTAAQLADTAAAVMQAGARMLHLHVRDEHGRHTLAAAAYHAAIEAIRAKAGDDLFIQLTSEAAGIYSAEQQRRALYALDFDGADGVSVAPRELIRSRADTRPAADLLHHLAQRGVSIQYILYSTDDIAAYQSLLEQGVIPPAGHSVLLVVGRYGAQASTPEILHQMLDTPAPLTHWMVCAFGEREFECLVEAAKLGGHVRVGFENSLLLKSGQPAADNRQLVAQLLESGNPTARPLADGRQAREIMGGEISSAL